MVQVIESIETGTIVKEEGKVERKDEEMKGSYTFEGEDKEVSNS